MELRKINKLTVCNFCGHDINKLLENEVRLRRSQIADAAICDDCVSRLDDQPTGDKKVRTKANQDVQAPKEALKNLTTPAKLLNPREIFNLVSKHVAGQDDAKRAVAIAVSNHLRSAGSQKRSNVLLMGPSGTGKTQIARALAQELNIPFYFHDATNLTSYGYVGKDVDSIIQNLLSMCNYNIEKAESAIVFIDEIDKKAEKGVNSGEIGTNMVQDALLKMIEGDKITITSKNQKYVVNTSKILFICAGAFSGIELKTQTRRSIGMDVKCQVETTKDVNIHQALANYGMKPELLRRFSIIAQTHPHTKESLSLVLDGQESSITETYKSLYRTYNLEFVMEKSFQEHLVKEALKSPLPIAELNLLIEKASQKILFDSAISNSSKVTLTKNGYYFNNKKKVISYDE